jgi:diguanylate cyclase (GGDEF)-like protein/PAS domain S-box-containing protein
MDDEPVPSEEHDAVASARAWATVVAEIAGDHLYAGAIGPDGAYEQLFTGPGLERLLGGPLEPGADPVTAWLATVHPDDRDVRAALGADLAAGGAALAEYRVVGVDGRTRWVRHRGLPRGRDAHGRPLFYGLIADVTDERELREHDARLEAEMRARDERHRSVLASMSEGVVVRDAEGRLVTCNASAQRLLGLTPDELDRRIWLDPPWRTVREDGTEVRRGETPAETTLATGTATLDVVLGISRPDGTTTWVSVNTEPLRLPDGPGHGTVTSVTDITARKLAEDARRSSEARARMLAAEQAALRRIAEAVARGAETQVVFERVSEEIADLLGVERCSLFRFDRSGTVSLTGTWRTPGATGPEIGYVLDLEHDSAVRRVLRSGRPARVAPGDGVVAWPSLGERVAAPVRVGPRIWGAVVVIAPPEVAVPPDADERLERFADLVALAIGGAEARDAVARHVQRQEALRVVSERALVLQLHDALAEVSEIVADTLAVDLVGVAELDAAGGDLVLRAQSGAAELEPGARMPLATPSLVGHAVSARAGVLVEDLALDPRFASGVAASRVGARSGAAAPIAGPTGPWGAIGAYAREAAALDDGDLAFLAAAATILAAAVERDRAEEAMRHQALHDALTGIANRTLLLDRLRHALERAGRTRRHVAVAFVDLDHFKRLNDTAGHDVGDQLLVACAARLVRAVRPGDTVARLGGDEFAVVCEDIGGEGEALVLGERLLTAVAEPFAVADGIAIGASVGITLRGGGDDPQEALRDADTAMYRAKAAGRGRVELFDVAMRVRLLARLQIESDLRAGLERGELALHFQPIVSLGSGAVTGLEGLARWSHPVRGLVLPAEFIAIAEETGLIVPLGRSVISQACAAAARFNAARPDAAPLPINVNLSARQLADSGLLAHIQHELGAHALEPQQLGLEITESVLLDDNPLHAQRIEAIRALGVRLLLDDFGTGYSSLGYIQRFALDALKLDRLFVAGLGVSERDATIVAAVAQLAGALDLMLIAEGVEHREQIAPLKALGCHAGQGFYFARPRTADAIDVILREPPAWLEPGDAVV